MSGLGDDLAFFYNDAYIPVLGQRHGEALGKPIKDVWWDVWDDISPWIENTLSGGTIHLEDSPLIMQRKGFEEPTWWSFAYSPLIDGNGVVQGFIDVCIETTEKVLSARRLAAEQSRLRQLFNSSPAYMALLIGPGHRIEITNSGYQSLIGHSDVLGKSVVEILGDVLSQGYLDILDEVYRTGETYHGTSAKYAMQVVPGGPTVEHYVDFVYQAMKDEAGQTYGIFVNGVDVTARKKADDVRDVLHREMVHRIKNIMAIVGAVVTASLRTATSIEEARQTISARIESLGRTQELLTSVQGDTDLMALVREAMIPHVDNPDRLHVEGPPVRLSPQQAVGLSLALYELATNAAKYGALSVSGGKIFISWSTQNAGGFNFRWRETGGPPVSAPSRAGFGSKLTNRIVAGYFGGSGETIYKPQGVEFHLTGTTRLEPLAPDAELD